MGRVGYTCVGRGVRVHIRGSGYEGSDMCKSSSDLLIPVRSLGVTRTGG